MPQVALDVSFVGRILEEDVFTRSGILLLAKGTPLTSSDIFKLLRQKIHYVSVESALITSEEEVNPVSRLLENFYIHKEVSAAYVQALEDSKELFDSIHSEYIPPLDNFTQNFFPLMDHVLQNTGIFRALYVLEGAEGYTYRHSINVGILSALIAKLLKLSATEVFLAGQAGLLHDVGKMLVPSEILLKPGKLTVEEFEQMKLHTVHGYKLLSKMEGGHELFAQAALLHHERLDGSGYPEKRVGDTIPFFTQIISVADVFDAICSDRVYKGRTSPFEAAALLWKEACSGALNPDIVTRFIHYIASLYTGSKAKLNNGEEVEVVLVYQDEPMRPLVRKQDEYIDLRHNRNLAIDKMIG
ncbi:HD-GYP domain-containing protein [Brevibacillus ginsengisoli]|uniref:HD-GYP domain-containing protein n=1 Tax=Brevibacillus ginsengisoli TaxID=363854 RepID=UPI003CF35C89